MIDSDEIKKVVEGRKVEYLIHFTRYSNLGSILQNGLMSRSALEQKSIPYEFNDNLRLDRQENAVCCSICHPNYKMFYPLRLDNPNVEWFCIICKPDILWEKDCAFCVINAASTYITNTPIQQRKGIHAFNLMFAEFSGYPSRNELGLPDNCPTSPQAEILVFDKIETKYIFAVICQNSTRASQLNQLLHTLDLTFLHAEGFFGPRKDYEHWR